MIRGAGERHLVQRLVSRSQRSQEFTVVDTTIRTLMSTKDHNETLVGIHAVVGSVFALGLFGSPWIIARNFRHADQIPSAVLVFGIVLVIAVLMFSTAIAMRRQKPVGRKLGLCLPQC